MGSGVHSYWAARVGALVRNAQSRSDSETRSRTGSHRGSQSTAEKKSRSLHNKARQNVLLENEAEHNVAAAQHPRMKTTRQLTQATKRIYQTLLFLTHRSRAPPYPSTFPLTTTAAEIHLSHKFKCRLELDRGVEVTALGRGSVQVKLPKQQSAMDMKLSC